MAPRVELLFWDGCPSHPRALADLRAALADAGSTPTRSTCARSDDDAAADARALHRLAHDPHRRRATSSDPGDEPVRPACRVYHRRDGRISPVPDPDDLRDALRRAHDHRRSLA